MKDLFGEEIETGVPKMPEEYRGEVKAGCGYTKSAPRDWTDEEIAWIQRLKQRGFSVTQIAESVERTETSVSVKLKRLGKMGNTYNQDHVRLKYSVNAQFVKEIKPSSVLDLYCGVKSWYKNLGGGVQVTANDCDKDIPADYHERAELLVHRLYYERNEYDLVDLDPFGSAYDCFDLAIKMARKGLAVTFGEMGHKRFKRLDYVRRYYGIESMEEFTLDRFVDELRRIAIRNKKRLIVFRKIEWNRIARVWFKIEEIKITEQWEKE